MSGKGHMEKFKANHLQPGEEIAAWADGYIGDLMGSGKDTQHNGALIVTSHRVAFYRDGFLGNIMETISLRAITSIERKSMLGHHTITLHASPNSLRFKCFSQAQERGIISAIEAFRNKVQDVSRDSALQNHDVLEQLERLAKLFAAGALTQAEYSAQKHRLIGTSALSDNKVPDQVDITLARRKSFAEEKSVNARSESISGLPSAVQGSAADKTCKKCGFTSFIESPTAASACQKCGAIFAKMDALGARDAAPAISAAYQASNNKVGSGNKGSKSTAESSARPSTSAVLSSIVVVLLLGLFAAYLSSDSKNPKVADTGATVGGRQSTANIPVVISQFESSSFFRQYTSMQTGGVFSLQGGGTAYNYFFEDPDNGPNSIGVTFVIRENGSFASLGVTLPGTSVLDPGRLTTSRQEMIRELYTNALPSVAFADVLRVALLEQTRFYDGGVSQMPERQIGVGTLKVGTVGSALVVVYKD